MNSFLAAVTIAMTMTMGSMTVASAQTPSRVEQFDDWGSYAYSDRGEKVCYVLSVPTTMRPATVDHGDVFFLLTRKPEAKLGFEAEVVMGYPLRGGSEVTVNVDDERFRMFTNGENAWMVNLAREPLLVKALRAGREMKIDAISKRGTKTRYTYSLAGVTAALKSIATCR